MNGCHAKLREAAQFTGTFYNGSFLFWKDRGRGFELGNIAKLFHDNVILQASQL